MIVVKERSAPQRIFNAIRDTVRNFHPESEFDDDPCSAPFLFKSRNAKIWVRVFYRAMSDSVSEELENEMSKLMVLMPKEARVYCFYPSLNQEQMLRFKDFHARVVFFEYGGWVDGAAEEPGIRVRKWVPISDALRGDEVIKGFSPSKESIPFFLHCARLSTVEMRDLIELGLQLRQP